MEWETLVLILGIGVLLLACYTFIPDLFLHRLGLGSWKRQYTHGVALTFDDGPNPLITPKILDILDEHQIKAVFFLVGKEAEKHQELVREILARGHEIGMHGENHRYAWGLSPGATWHEWNACKAKLEEIAGREISWIRPPWGTFNLATWWWMKKNKKQAVLWTVEGHDWQGKRTPEQIADRVVKQVREGAIIVLHDQGGDEGAAENTLQALNEICTRIVREKKLPFVALSLPSWSRRRRISYVLFERWEQLFARLYKVERIDEKNLLRLSLTKYKGPDIYEQGVLLAHQGDEVGEIHLDSIRLQSDSEDMQKVGIRALRKVRDSLPVMAQFIVDNPKYDKVKVFVGLSLLNRGIKGLGFNVQDVEISLFSRGVGKLQKAIMRNFHPAGKNRENSRLGDQPKLIWISRQTLLEKWLAKEETLDLNRDF